MTSEQRRQESEAYWFRSPAARNVLEDFAPARRDEETILDEGGPEPERGGGVRDVALGLLEGGRDDPDLELLDQ